MSFYPLPQSPFLDNLCRLLKRKIFTRNVSPEQFELATLVRAFEKLWRRTCESGDTGGVGKCFVKFGSCGTEFFVRRQRRSIHRGMTSCIGCGCFGSRFGGARLGVCLGGSGGGGNGRRLQGRRGTSCMLKIFAVFGDECRTKLRQPLTKLRNYFGANQILDRLFGGRV